jgi:hypothetical protein
MSISARVSRFDALVYGLRFPNNFPDATWLGVIHAPGLCGGMAFAVLDHFYADIAAPTMATTPSVTSPYGAYVQKRQLDSFTANGARFIGWILDPVDAHLADWTGTLEWTRLRVAIDAQTPVPLGLVAGPYRAGLNATDSHVVVAVGYRQEDSGARVVICWDPNHPLRDREIRLDAGPGPQWQGPGSDDRYRGWFVETYGPVAPPPPSPEADVDTSDPLAAYAPVLPPGGVA